MEINIYTDGSSRGNPGPGGYGAILEFGKHKKELSAGYKHTTNNRMELMAVIAALEALTKTGLSINIYTDSKYVCDAIEKKWLNGWIAKEFKKVKNPDLWKRLNKLLTIHKVKFIWIRGHNGHPQNERCDQLATFAADNNALLIDDGFVNNNDINEINLL